LSFTLLRKIHPIVVAIVSALFVTSCLIAFSSVDPAFKAFYRVVCFVMIFGVLVFESWRIDHLEPDWKKKCEELEKR
jgi:ABC-type transport system involved in cytochrome bd biosynthesis fused ATPase/permease subunit